MHSCSRSTGITFAVLLSCLLAGGCAREIKSLGEVSKLYAELVKEYNEQKVGINLNNGTVLRITFINSPLNSSGPEERKKRAEQTAAFVVQHYTSINQIEEIWVGFVRTETRFFVIHY